MWHFSCAVGPLTIQNMVFAGKWGESHLAHTPVLASLVSWLGECDHLLSIHKIYELIRIESEWVRVSIDLWIKRSQFLLAFRWQRRGILQKTSRNIQPHIYLPQSWAQFLGSENSSKIYTEIHSSILRVYSEHSAPVAGMCLAVRTVVMNSKPTLSLFFSMIPYKAWFLGIVILKQELFVVGVYCSPSIWCYLKISL